MLANFLVKTVDDPIVREIEENYRLDPYSKNSRRYIGTDHHRKQEQDSNTIATSKTKIITNPDTKTSTIPNIDTKINTGTSANVNPYKGLKGFKNISLNEYLVNRLILWIEDTNMQYGSYFSAADVLNRLLANFIAEMMDDPFVKEVEENFRSVTFDKSLRKYTGIESYNRKKESNNSKENEI